VLAHQPERIIARLLAQLRVKGDVPADQRLKRRAEAADQAPRADAMPRTTPMFLMTRQPGSSKAVVIRPRSIIGARSTASPVSFSPLGVPVEDLVDRIGDVNVARRRDRHVMRFAEIGESRSGLTHGRNRLAVRVEPQDLT